MTSRVTALMIGWSALCSLGMLTGLVAFLARGYSIVDASPIVFFSAMSLYIWVPIATLAAREHRAANHTARPANPVVVTTNPAPAPA
jgi:hypothetical protein